MKVGKKLHPYATFSRFVSILLCVMELSGCVRSPPIPEDRFERADVLVAIGTGFLKKRELPEARRAFELASELAPSAAAVDGKGCVALLEGRYEDAERFFLESYRMDRNYDNSLVNLGLAKELQGKIEEAMDIYLEYLDNNPDSAKVRNNLAALEYDRGMRTMVTVESLEKAIALSDQAVIRENLAMLQGK